MASSGRSIDKGWAWVVLFAVFCNTTILGMLYPSVAIFYVKFLDVFGESRSYTSWLGALNTMFMFSSASLSSSVIPYIGVRNVFFISGGCLMVAYVTMSLSHSLIFIIVTYGVLGGIGFGFMLTAGVAAVARYFKRYLFQATSISFVGGGIGTLIYGPILEGLIFVFGWRGAALLYAGISAHILLVGCVVFPEPKPKVKMAVPQPLLIESGNSNHHQSTVESGNSDIDDIEPAGSHQDQSTMTPLENKNCRVTSTSELIPIRNVSVADYSNEPTQRGYPTKAPSAVKRFRNPEFWCLSYMALTWGFTITTFVGIFKDLVSTCGLLPYFQLAATASGVGNVLGRVLVGFLSFEHVILSFGAVFVMGSTVTMIFTVATLYWVLMAASGVMGLFLGATFLMVPTSVGAVYGRKDMAVMYGYVMFAIGITSWMGPALIGHLRDLTGAYDSGLYVLASIQLSGAAMAVVLKLRMRRKASKTAIATNSS